MNINDFRDGQKYDKWLPLKNVKMGRLHLRITVFEDKEKVTSPLQLYSHVGILSNKVKHLFYYSILKQSLEPIC